MDTTASFFLISAVLVAALGGLGLWFAVKRPARQAQLRKRDEALAAAERYTPAARAPVYGTAPAPAVATATPDLDPCAPGLSDHERVDAMRTLLLNNGRRLAAEAATHDTEPLPLPLHGRDDPQSTTPMAWNPTLPPDQADVVEAERRARRAKRTAAAEADHEHITVF